MLSDFLIKSPMIERLDISNNLINAQGAYCLAWGLSFSKSIIHVKVEGNPITKEGR
jgi:hypothetical protein